MNTHQCGGTVLNERFILTSAHCAMSNGLLGVGTGGFLPDVFVRGRKRIKRFIVHPEYTEETFPMHDIALAELDEPLSFENSTVRPACLYVSFDDKLLRSVQMIMIGHGPTEPMVSFQHTSGLESRMSRPNSYNLKQLYMYRLAEPSKVCQRSVFCAIAMDVNEGPCVRDSGGPLQVTISGLTFVVGVFSGGSAKFNAQHKIAFDCIGIASFNLIPKYIDFIVKNIKGSLCEFQ